MSHIYLTFLRSHIFTGSKAESEKVAIVLSLNGSWRMPFIFLGLVAKWADIESTSDVVLSIRISYIRTYDIDVPTANV